MKREQLDKLTVEKQLEIFNKIIKEQGSLSKAIKVTGMPKSTIKGRLEKIGYKYSEEAKQFVKDINTQPKSETSLIEPVSVNKDDIKKEDKTLIDTTELEQIVNKLIDKRLEALKKVEKSSSIELSSECEGDVKYRSFGVYKNVLDRFMKFAENHPRYNKVELLSHALTLLMESCE